MEKLDNIILNFVMITIEELSVLPIKQDWSRCIDMLFNYETISNSGKKTPDHAEEFYELVDAQMVEFHKYIMKCFYSLSDATLRNHIYPHGISKETLLDIRSRYDDLIETLTCELLDLTIKLEDKYPEFYYDLENIIDETSKMNSENYIRSSISMTLDVIFNDIIDIINKESKIELNEDEAEIEDIMAEEMEEQMRIEEEEIVENVSVPMPIVAGSKVEMEFPKPPQSKTLSYDTMISYIPSNEGKPEPVASKDLLINKYIDVQIENALYHSNDQFILESNLRQAINIIMDLDAKYTGTKVRHSRFKLIDFVDVNTFRLIKLSKKGNMLLPDNKGFVQIVFTQGRIDVGTPAVPSDLKTKPVGKIAGTGIIPAKTRSIDIKIEPTGVEPIEDIVVDTVDIIDEDIDATVQEVMTDLRDILTGELGILVEDDPTITSDLEAVFNKIVQVAKVKHAVA